MKVEMEIRFKPGYIVLYHTEDGMPMTSIPGKVDANNAFATKEEADACPPYNPTEGKR